MTVSFLRKSVFAFAFGLLMLMSVGCYRRIIIEDRTYCPATIQLFSDNTDVLSSDDGKSVYLRIYGDGFIGESMFFSLDALRSGVVFTRAKNSHMRVSAIWDCPSEEKYWHGGYLVVPEGEDMFQSYADYQVFDISSKDYQQLFVSMRPLFTTIICSLSGGASGSVEVRSDFGGYHDPDLLVTKGEYVREYGIDCPVSFNVPDVSRNRCVLFLKCDGRLYRFGLSDFLESMNITGTGLSNPLKVAFDVGTDGQCHVSVINNEEFFSSTINI